MKPSPMPRRVLGGRFLYALRGMKVSPTHENVKMPTYCRRDMAACGTTKTSCSRMVVVAGRKISGIWGNAMLQPQILAGTCCTYLWDSMGNASRGCRHFEMINHVCLEEHIWSLTVVFWFFSLILSFTLMLFTSVSSLLPSHTSPSL